MKNNNKKIKPAGRPSSVLKEDVMTKLESILKVGGTISEACSYARIPERTYYYTAEKNESFLQRMETAKHYADIVAKKVVVDSIINDKDLTSAKWWLEKREFRDKGTSVNVNFQQVINNADKFVR